MKIVNSRNILILLSSTFVIVNLIFLIIYYYTNNSNDSKNDNENNIDNEYEEEVKILQKIVDFNNTSFVNNGVVHFYNPANQKVNIKNNEHHNKPEKDLRKNNPTYIYDKESRIFIDYNLNFCRAKNFDIKQLKCSSHKIKFKYKNDHLNLTMMENTQYQYIEFNCDEKIKCCSKNYECLYKCIEMYGVYTKDNSSTINHIILQKCIKLCQLKIYTKNYVYPFCYLSSEIFSIRDVNITIGISNE